MQFLVRVGYSIDRPIVPDEEFRPVWVEAENWIEAMLLAAQIVACNVTMVTSTEIEEEIDVF